jgi:hypothetical protein
MNCGSEGEGSGVAVFEAEGLGGSPIEGGALGDALAEEEVVEVEGEERAEGDTKRAGRVEVDKCLSAWIRIVSGDGGEENGSWKAD